MFTYGAEHVSTAELQHWLGDPKSKKLIYCTGELSRVCGIVSNRNKNAQICAIREVLWSAEKAGLVLLVQRALGPPSNNERKFEYIAIKRQIKVRPKRQLESIFL